VSVRTIFAVVAAVALSVGAAWLLLPEFGGGWGALTAKLRFLQMDLQRELASAVRSVRDGGWAAAWPLASVSFLYGIAHAAGPGHGKAVIGAYVLADGRRLRRGLALAWASAMLQAVTAVTLIMTAVWLLGMTAREAQAASVWLERGGYALILALGLLMLWRGGMRLRPATAAQAHVCGGCGGHHHHDHEHHAHEHHEHDHHDHERHEHEHHDHEHGAACGHVPPPPPDDAGLREAVALVVSVGLRPCSGALLVLTFASAAGVFAAGVVSAFAMAVGTAITVSALAVLASSSRRLALAAAAGDARRLGLVEGGLILAAGLALAAMGGLFLAGSFAPVPAMPFR
jgi:nickel/cobalt transporter (NicO) family protein